MLSKSRANKTANEVSRDAVRRHNQGVPHFQNTVLRHGTRLRVFTFTLIIIIIIIIIIKLVDTEESYRWRKSGDIKGETESTIVAAQDQAINTNYFKNKILKEEIEIKCRLCKQHEETIDHLTSGCPILAKNEYLMRHDKVLYTFALLSMQSLRL